MLGSILICKTAESLRILTCILAAITNHLDYTIAWFCIFLLYVLFSRKQLKCYSGFASPDIFCVARV